MATAQPAPSPAAPSHGGLSWSKVAPTIGLSAALWPKGEVAPKRGQPSGPFFGGGTPKVEGLKAASEAAKQFVTLDVAMVGLTVTFLEKIVQPVATAGRTVTWQMEAAWIFYVVSLIGGVATLLGVCGTLTTLDRFAMKLPTDPDRDDAFDVYSPTVRIPMLIMVIGFVLAIGFTVAAAWSSAAHFRSPPASPAASSVHSSAK